VLEKKNKEEKEKEQKVIEKKKESLLKKIGKKKDTDKNDTFSSAEEQERSRVEKTIESFKQEPKMKVQAEIVN
jgi:hypothetical protein